MTREELERIDELHMRAWNEQNIDAFLELLADQFVWRDLTVPEPMTTPEAARAYMLGWFTAFPDMRVTVTSRVVGEDAVAAEVEFTGTNSGRLSMGGTQLPPTQKSVTGRGAYFVKIREGKMTEFSTHPDVAGMMAQLGMLPEPADAQPATPRPGRRA
ncbi:MAG: ester cyclase [Nocardioidaceae bacterium]